MEDQDGKNLLPKTVVAQSVYQDHKRKWKTSNADGRGKAKKQKTKKNSGKNNKVGSICVMNTIKIIIVLPLGQVIYITLHGTGIVFGIQTLSVAIDMAFYHAFVPHALPQINE